MHHFTCMLLALLISGTACAQSFEVDVLFSARHRPHVELVKVLEHSIRADDIRLFPGLENGDQKEEKALLERIQDRKPDLLVVVGEDALQAVLAENIRIPVLSMMSMTLNSKMQQRLDISGIDLRPSQAVVADGLAQLLPRRAKILSYYDPDYSAAYVDEATELFRRRHLELIARPWPEHDIQVELNSSMKTADAYWMQLEYRSVEPDTLRLLFSLAKHGKKLIGLSAKYVRAGALVAWSPQVRFIGRQAARLANRVLGGERASHIAIQHPEKMKVHIRTEDVGSGGHDE